MVITRHQSHGSFSLDWKCSSRRSSGTVTVTGFWHATYKPALRRALWIVWYILKNGLCPRHLFYYIHQRPFRQFIDSWTFNWVLRRKQHFLFDLLLKVIDFLTIYPGVVISQLYVGPCQLWCVSNHGLNSRSLTVTPCKTFTFSINYQRIWVHEKIYSKLHLPHDLPPGLAWHLT